jgi:hypothetical protein
MKKTALIFLLPLIAIVGCNSSTKPAAANDMQADSLHVPQNKYLTDQQLQDQVNQEIKDLLSVANDARISDANEIINLTEQAVQNILDSTYTRATENLEEAIGKAEVLTTSRPDLSMIPLDIQIGSRDLVADIGTVKEMKKEAEHLTNKGDIQSARHLLDNMASELEISAPMLPMATYPDALSLAAAALKNNNPDDALILLNTALNTVYIETWYVPLPLIRAERMLSEVSTLLEKGNKTSEVNTLLENAEYQIRFAEALGYGKKDREFQELYTSIKQIKSEVNKENAGDSAGLTQKLRTKLKSFKERISRSSDETHQQKTE